jgi:rhodanese-related sulfurtransferase
MTSAELNQRMSKEAGALLVLDVRSARELVQTGRVRGSLHIPLPELRGRLQELQPYRDREVVVICRAGLRAYIAARILAQSGFPRVHVLSGGILEWHYELERADA